MGDKPLDLNFYALVISAFSALISVLSLIATTLALQSKRSQKYLWVALCLSVILTGFFYLQYSSLHGNSPIAIASATSSKHFDSGMEHYQSERFIKAIEEFTAAVETELTDLNAKEIKAKTAAAHFYLGSSYLRLSSPDCEKAFRQMPRIKFLDSAGGFSEKLFAECKQAGCAQCRDTIIP